MLIRNTIAASFVLLATCAVANAQKASTGNSSGAIPQDTLIQIMRAEDERRWDDKLQSLLSSQDAGVRKRAVLAAGRIGDQAAAPLLSEMVLMDRDSDVRRMAAFALGEIEAAGGAYALISVLKDENKPGRARAIEALGKIIAAMISSAPAAANQGSAKDLEDDRLDIMKAEMLSALRFEDNRRAQADRETILLGLTAVLRARPEGVGRLVARFLEYSDPAIIATALNTMARLRLKDGNDRVRQLLKHNDPLVRANAARLIGAAEHKEAFDDLLAKAVNDPDLRVRVSAIRSLVALKDAKAATPLLSRGKLLLNNAKSTKLDRPGELNEILEIVTTLGNLLRDSKSTDAIKWLRDVRRTVNAKAPEVEIAMARVDPEFYITEEMKFGVGSPATVAQGLREIATIKKTKPDVEKAAKFIPDWMREFLGCSLDSRAKPTGTKPRKCLDTLAVSPFLQAYAAYQPADLNAVLIARLSDGDVIVRSTAAELIGGQPPNEANTRALIDALPRALRDKDNAAALAILDALGKQKNAAANEAIKSALDSDDHLIRRRAVARLKANGAGDFSDRIGFVKTNNTPADYRRAIGRIGKRVSATVVTGKGSFTIEFLPEEAPLTVDNFIQLARRGYFNGQTIPRVVPNFVVQAGDPRGDQSGGPGYSIRCEINEVPFERATLGMALSGKDTGGSQWFVTHSPQPHLDGGYTVFGRVINGMDVVDKITRGEKIRRVIVNER